MSSRRYLYESTASTVPYRLIFYHYSQLLYTINCKSPNLFYILYNLHKIHSPNLIHYCEDNWCWVVYPSSFSLSKRAKRTRAFSNTRVRFCYFVVRYLAPAPFPSKDSFPTFFSFCRILYA